MRPRNLLVVEDDPDTSNLLKLYFTGHGFAVRIAARGEEAIQAARALPPDLVLLDFALPGMDGAQVCQRLRATPRTSHVPIIFLSEKTSQSDKRAGLSAGAQDYVTKPFDLEELRLRVQNLIGRADRDNLLDPRTGLPTGRLVDDQIRRVAGQPEWHLMECRIDAFRPFLDLNGFAAGDDVLTFAGQLLREEIEKGGTTDDFVGHPANDTFVLLTGVADAAALGAALKARFDEEVKTHYSFTDREQGFVEIRQSDGQVVRAPLMTLTVGIRTP